MMGEESTYDRVLIQLEGTEKTVKKLRKHLRTYLLETTSISDMEPLERAKANLNLAYLSAALFYMLLRTHGLDTSEHPVMQELQRIKERFELLSRLAGQEDRRSLVVDNEATGRILAATLTELPEKEKRKLRRTVKRKR
ncbi:hypothetical protein Gasu2_25400 [Galdieria sulphuraria]|uniref:Nuclear nucleic acid-binding protein C1D n=1 Tax=Galdieria sulphuraria TaxID=130081 RepID=M2Y4F3_GALSU|nr:uncharacterized protein Gasu_18400 [Galdieria sulphuraria]EME30823.1 hypothetical protein Gasu_18400 [Galdieria sulphuraria]GJD08236.1 hypothetical protein Gasu2_25400 [Galdieria sulphuraria]|eukprot:XP_005707343.1 hypothetical protein Gasu_18400 [Galdieria sulphuraria]